MDARGTDRAAFFHMPTCAAPTEHVEGSSNESVEDMVLALDVPGILAVCRLVRGMRASARDRLWGGRSSPEGDLEQQLHSWINNFVTSSGSMESEKRLRPLARTRVEIAPSPSHPGRWVVTLHAELHHPPGVEFQAHFDAP